MAGSGRFTRLKTVLGCLPEDCDLGTLQRLAVDGVPESEDHDYKAAPELRAQELAKDVAAFANSGGGVIIVGIDEDRLGSLAALVPVAANDQELRRVTQVIASQIHPYPSFRLKAVSAEDGQPSYYLIIIESSVDTPHAVSNNEASVMKYPVRSGTTTRYLREPEVAARYRDRIAGVGIQMERLESVWTGGLSRIRDGGNVWLALAAVPAQAGSLSMTAKSVHQARDWLHAWSQSALCLKPLSTGDSVTVGRRCVLLGNQSSSGPAWGHVLDLHNDGSSFAALPLAVEVEGHALMSIPVLPVIDIDIDIWVLTLLGLAGSHAVRTGAGGDMDVRVQLVGPRWQSSTVELPGPTGPASFPVRQIAVALVMKEMLIGGWIPWGPRHAVPEPSSTAQTVPLSVAADARDLVAAAAYLVSDVVAEFGEAEPTMLRADGTIDLAQLRKDRAMVESWSVRNHVPAQMQTTAR